MEKKRFNPLSPLVSQLSHHVWLVWRELYGGGTQSSGQALSHTMLHMQRWALPSLPASLVINAHLCNPNTVLFVCMFTTNVVTFYSFHWAENWVNNVCGCEDTAAENACSYVTMIFRYLGQTPSLPLIRILSPISAMTGQHNVSSLALHDNM